MFCSDLFGSCVDSTPDAESVKSVLPSIPVQVISYDDATGLLR